MRVKMPLLAFVSNKSKDAIHGVSIRLLLFLLAFICLFAPAYGATITVVANNGADLKRAIETTANAGDIVELPVGTYLLSSQIAWPNKNNITLRAVSGGNPTNVIISASATNQNRFALLNFVVSLSIQNLTLQNFGGANWQNDGGVFYFNANVTLNIQNCVLSGNAVNVSGGCFYKADNGGYVNAQGVLFQGNQANNGGVAYMGTHVWTNCVMVSNSTTSIGGVAYFGTYTWTNCVVVNNNASAGAVGAFGDYSWTNCSISGNNSTTELINSAIKVTAKNTILAGKLLAGGVYPFAFRNCLIQGDSVSNYTVLSVDVGNINSSNALFTDSMLHVGPNSPAIDGGSLALWNANSGNVTTDIEGNPRTIQNCIDMGAYQTNFAVTSMNGQIYGSISRPLNIASDGSLIEVITSSVLVSHQIEWPNINNITLRAGAGYNASNCIISASAINQTRFASLNYAVSLSIQNLTLQNFGGANWQNDGGVFYFNANVTLNIQNCVLSGNAVNGEDPVNLLAGNSGGCFYKADNGGYVNAQGVLFQGNQAHKGGVAYMGTHVWTNCVMVSNIVIPGILQLGGGAVEYYGMHTWTNCSVSGNDATTGLIYNDMSIYKATVNNTILAGKLLAGNIFNMYNGVVFRNCLIQGDTVLNYTIGAGSGANMNNSMAGFADAVLHIKASSPAIDGGSLALWNQNSSNVTTDIEGNPRTYANLIDMGAYQTNFPVTSMNGQIFGSLARPLNIASNGSVIEVITGSVLLSRQLEWPNVNNITLRAGTSYNALSCIISASETNVTRFASLNYAVSLSIQNLTIQNFGGTTWANNGGVFYFNANVTLNIQNCAFLGNAVQTNARSGGCFYKTDNGGLVNAKNVVFQGNQALNGGVAYKGAHVWNNCSLSGNNTTTELIFSSHNVTANNTIFSGKLLAGGMYPLAFQNCLIQGDSVSNYTVSQDVNNIGSSNAMFTDSMLHIGPNSPAIDRGSLALWNANSGNVTSDLEGNPRTICNLIDMGAYETNYGVTSMNGQTFGSLARPLNIASNGSVIEVITGSVLLSRQLEWPNVNSITLRAGAGYNSSNCIISASATNLTRFASLNYAVSLSVQNLTLQNFGGTAWNNDGGVFYFNANATLNLLRCVLSGNAVSFSNNKWGGCFYKSDTGGLVNAQGVRFQGNSAYMGGVSVGGSHAWKNCSVISNSAASSGGVAVAGMHVWTNCSISGNNMTTPLIYNNISTFKLTANNTILAGKLLAGGVYPFAFRNCLIQGDSVSNYAVSVNVGNINSANAMFMDDSLIVSQNSPAVNAGSNDLWSANSGNVTSDYRGYPRILKTTIDIGAYEIDIPSAITFSKRLLSYSPIKPTFTWSAPDSYTPITGYQVYFGPSAQGTSENSTGLAMTYTPPALVKGAYYFRVSAQNADHNSGPWNTVYIYNRPAYRVRIE